MIEKLNSWTQNIIIAVIISIIIEMILPDGNNKKYVKVVTGLYVLYIIVSPIFNLKNPKTMDEIEKILITNNTVPTVSEADIANTYILSLQDVFKDKIQEAGYKVENLKLYVNSDYSEILKIEIKMKSGVNYNKDEIVKIIKSIYDINEKNIVFI